MRISVISPVYSEEDSVRQLVKELRDLIPEQLHQIILVVAPHSTVASRTLCQKLSQDYPMVEVHIQRDNPGLGRAIREGFEYVTGSHVLLIDSDGEMETATVPAMVAKMEATGCHMVVGSRWIRGGGVYGYDTMKYLFNRSFQYLFRLLFWTSIHDLTLGYKLLEVSLVKSLRWSSHFHEFATESTLLPIRTGYEVAEVPTVWRRRKQGKSKNKFSRNFAYVWKALDIWWNGKKRSATNSR